MATIKCATLPPLPTFAPFEVQFSFNPALGFLHPLPCGALA